MTDIRQRISWAASSKHCLQTCPCLQVPLLTSHQGEKPRTSGSLTKEHHAHVVPDLHKRTYSLRQHKHHCMAPGPRTADLERNLEQIWRLWSQTPGAFPTGLCGLCVITPVLHLYPKTAVDAILDFFRIFFPLCGCKSRTLFVSNR